METDSQHLMHSDTNGQHIGTTTTQPSAKLPTQPKQGGKKPTAVGNTAKQKSTTKGTEHAALAEAQRKAADAQAGVEELQRRLAAVEATLAEERQKSSEAQRMFAEQRRVDDVQTEIAERATEQTQGGGGGEATFGLMPLVGFRGTDIFNVSRQVAEQVIKQPPVVLKHYTNFLLEMGKVVTGRSTVEPGSKDKRFRDEMWKTNPFYHAYLQTYLTWQQSLNAFINDTDLETTRLACPRTCMQTCSTCTKAMPLPIPAHSKC